MPCDNQKLVIFDDYLNTGTKDDAEIRNTLLIPEIKTAAVSIYLKAIMVLIKQSD